MSSDPCALKRKYMSITDDDYFTICVSAIAKCGTAVHQICNNRIFEYDILSTWEDVIKDIVDDEGFDLHKTDLIHVQLSKNSNAVDTECFKPDMKDFLRVVKNFNSSLKFVKFQIDRNENVGFNNNTSGCCSKESETGRTAFTVLISGASAKKFPELNDVNNNSHRFTAKDGLYNSLVQQMMAVGDKFPGVMSQEDVRNQMSILVNAVWYNSGNMQTIQERGVHMPEIQKIPERFLQFDGVNDYKKKKHKKPNLSSKDLKLHSQCLFRLITRQFSKEWILRNDIEKLAFSFDSYAHYLEDANEMQKIRQISKEPIRQADTHTSIAFRSATHEVTETYRKLDYAVNELNNFQPLFVDEEIHKNGTFDTPMKRLRFYESLHLSCPIHQLRYDPGGGLGAINFIWKVPENINNEDAFGRDMGVLRNLRSRLPEFHTRQMRREFCCMYENVAGTHIPPHILRSIYTTLTNDASAEQDKEIDERVRLAVLSLDPDLVVDLRHLNKGRPGDTFEAFFGALETEVEDLVAADERRHNIEHISKYISVRDLIEQVRSKLPEGVPIPSESTVLFAFVPKNAHNNVAKLYKGRIPLRLKVQTRQLRTSHQDEHYCAAMFKYIKQYAIKVHDDCTFVCMDDKSKVDFGEPGQYTSSGVRGKKSIVPMNSTLSCLDHDVQSKGSLTPSVILEVAVPRQYEDSFYRGQVYVTFKDSIFQPSTPFRHVVELQHILEAKEERKPGLFMYTDGGPDHRVTYGAVKLSLIVLFKRMNLEFLVACRTAPGHSWANPAERIMSLLNLAFQNTALAREQASADVETAIRSCSSMKEIRKKAERNHRIKDEWLQSVQPIIETLTSRATRVQLKGEQCQVFKAASDDEVEMAEAEVTLIDPTIQIGHYQQQHLVRSQQLKKVIADHCLERHYSFQIRRCKDINCCSQTEKVWEWLPDPVEDASGNHYKKFEDLLGHVTDEKDRPSSRGQTTAAVAQELQGCKNSVLVAQNVRSTVTCTECMKPRCIYAKSKLTTREERSLKHTLENIDYTCGSLITPNGDILQGKVFVRLQMSCQSPIEFPYYSSTVGRVDVCAHCTLPAEKSPEML